MVDPYHLRGQFPMFSSSPDTAGPLIYLDNAATTQKPQQVIDAITQYYSHQNANIHRGIYPLADQSTKIYEQAREAVASFINAEQIDSIVFTAGTTDAINMVAHGWKHHLTPEDEVLVTAMEHHANYVPWQLACKQSGAIFRELSLGADGSLDLSQLERQLSPKTRILAITQVHNATGIINPVKEIIEIARQYETLVLVDAAQSVGHMTVDVQELDCDFLTFSGHKMFGPMGVGVLYGKLALLELMHPYRQGGSMIQQVSKIETTFRHPPHKFEAGTPPVASVAGIQAAVKFVNSLGVDSCEKHSLQLRNQLWEQLEQDDAVMLYGRREESAGILSFNLKDVHPHDLATVLAESGIAVRAGHHCCQPLMHHLGIAGTVRASFSVYNHNDEVEVLLSALKEAKQLLL